MFKFSVRHCYTCRRGRRKTRAATSTRSPRIRRGVRAGAPPVVLRPVCPGAAAVL